MRPSRLTLLAACALALTLASTEAVSVNLPAQSELALDIEPVEASPLDAASLDATPLDAAFSDLVEDGFTGLAAVAVDGELIYVRSQSSEAYDFTLETPVDILSMTKSFTGAAVGHLILEGRLSASTRLDDIFDDVPDDKAAITVHQLLTHASGFGHALGPDHEVIGREAYITEAKEAELLFQPGARYEYSNIGYSLLAAVVEHVTEQTFDDYLREAILAPAGMTATGYQIACCETDRARSVVETSWGGGTASWHLIGNGGMLSTPRDMMSWIAAMRSDEETWNALRALTRQPYQREGETAPSHYGYGLVVEDHPAYGRAYWHNGGSRAFNGHWRYYADHDVAIFVTADQWDVDPDRVERVLAAAVFDKE